MHGKKQTWVIDTNVLVSAFLSEKGAPAHLLLAAAEGRFTPAYTPEILAEYMDVLNRPKFGFPSLAVANFLSRLMMIGQEVDPLPLPRPLPDADDEVFLAAALASPSRVLVTGNARHFPPEICRPVRVLTPAEALKHI